MTTKEAVDKISEDLKDSGYFIAWKSNIAMSIIDELSREGIQGSLLNKIINKGVENFLNNLISRKR